MFQKILSGEKKFDLRLADFDCQEGDTLILQEYDPQKQKYTGREVSKTIGFVLKTKDLTYWPQSEVQVKGFIVMSLT